MGLSNITQNIETDLCYHLGEKEQKLERIQRIEQLVQTLPDLRERLKQLDGLITAGEMLRRERIPGWTPERIRPIQKFKCRSPITFGDGVRKGLEALKNASHHLTTREITDEVLAREGIFDLDRATWERFRSNIDAGLLKHQQKGLVASDGRKPARWWLIRSPQFQVIQKPLALSNADEPQCFLE